MESADERALRRELQELNKKREALDNAKRRGPNSAVDGASGRRSVFARLGGEVTRSGGGRLQLKENGVRGNAVRRLGKRDGDRFDADSPRNDTPKRQRLHSAVNRPEGAPHSDGRVEHDRTSPRMNPTAADTARSEQRKQRAVAPYAQKDGIARSRRMFGALMGHLGKAKRQIEKDTDLFKRQDSKQHEAEQREKMQAKDIEARARREAEVKRLEALIARTQLDRSEQIARAKLEHLQMVRKSEHQSKFLVTVSSPPVYYLPARHTKETEDLLAAAIEAHEAKMKARSRTHEDKLRKLEAEFAGKMEQLREELEAARTDEKESATRKCSEGDQAESEEEDMDASTKTRAEADEDTEVSHASAKVSNDEDIVLESVSESEPNSSPIDKASSDSNAKRDGIAADNGESQLTPGTTNAGDKETKTSIGLDDVTSTTSKEPAKGNTKMDESHAQKPDSSEAVDKPDEEMQSANKPQDNAALETNVRKKMAPLRSWSRKSRRCQRCRPTTSMR